ncbi:MAG: fused MFS/spermidine synthase [Gammaproteobacteria bacterium]|nr:fused MFS/spermidine synthase [Gammaproteobacteria bacterium]
MSSKFKLFHFSLIIFCASAALMILEIVAARLLAPYVGVSLYTWTTLIGVLLAGLSLGNWLGGIWVDKGAGIKTAGLTLALSGILSLASLFFLTLIAPVLQDFRTNLILSSIIYVSALFLLPAVLLGIITPLLTALALKIDSRTGHILGRMHAMATLGSIAGTFASGYWLIQYFGTRNVIVGTAIALLILSASMLWTSKKVLISLCLSMFLILALTQSYDGLENPCDRESNYFCIRVVDENLPINIGEARSMILDHLAHGTNIRDKPEMLIAPYVQAMNELVTQHFENPEKLRYFFAGGGAYTLPRAIKTRTPLSEIHVAEIDPVVTDVAKEYFYINSKDFTVLHQDARPSLEIYPEKYFDVVIGDVFHDIAIPYHLVTKEFFTLVKSRLKPEGLYLMNVVDAFPNPKFVKSLVKTLQTQFDNVNIWLDKLPDKQQRMTFIISAGDTHLSANILYAHAGIKQTWFNIYQPLFETGSNINEIPYLTDDFAPVDRLISTLLLTDLGL